MCTAIGWLLFLLAVLLTRRWLVGTRFSRRGCHVGLCKARLGDMPGAIAAWQERQRRYRDTPCAKYAGERLAEQEKIVQPPTR